jgi:hypothetical protein
MQYLLVAGYQRIEDIRGECDTLYKKSLIARLRGDTELADDWSRRYIALYEDHFSALSDDEDAEDGEDSDAEADADE